MVLKQTYMDSIQGDFIQRLWQIHEFQRQILFAWYFHFKLTFTSRNTKGC